MTACMTAAITASQCTDAVDQPHRRRVADHRHEGPAFQLLDQARIELEFFRSADLDSSKFRVCGIQQIIRFRFNDGARNLQDRGSRRADPGIADFCKSWWRRITSPVNRKGVARHAGDESIIELAGNEHERRKQCRSVEVNGHLERCKRAATRNVDDRDSRRVPAPSEQSSAFTIKSVG